MAQSNDKSSRAKDQEDRRGSEEAAEQAAAASEPAKTVSEELAYASRDYYRAVYRAWLRAAEDSEKANFEFAAAQQGIMQAADAQRTAAYFNLLKAVQDTSGSALKEAYEACAKAFDDAAKAVRSGLSESQQNRQRVQAAASDAYASTIQDALNTYLSRIKAVWSSIDIAGVDPQTLTSLAAASVHATRAAQATPRAQA